ncbi:MAG: AI-2E family transporter [Pseudonocardiaceae bacterium]
MDDQRETNAAAPYPLRVAAALSWRFLAVAGALYVVGYVAIQLRVVVIPIAVALLLTALLGPLVDWLARRRVPRALATALVVIFGLAVVGGLLTFVVQQFVAGLPDLQRQVGDSVQAIRRFLESGPLGLPSWDNLLNQITDAITTNRETITTGALSTAYSVGEFFTGMAIAIFTLIVFLYRGPRTWHFVLKLVPAETRSRVDLAGQRSYASLVGYVRATALVAVVDAIGIGIGLLVVGAPLVVPLTALVFLFSFIPIAGAVISGTIAVLVVLVANGPVPALVVLAIVLGVQQLEGNVLQPLIMGRAAQLNALPVVLAVSVGTVLVGITGALLSVPLLAVLSSGIRSLTGDEVDPSAVNPNDPEDARPGSAAPGSAAPGAPAADEPTEDPVLGRTPENG